MDKQEIIESIGYCGLICKLCHLADECGGCKSSSNICAKHLSEAGCFQLDCCVEKDIDGCWECAEFPCGKDMHGPPHDLRIRAFVTYIKAEGAEALVDCLLRNEARGIHYGQGRDYDGKSSEEEVIRLLKTGLSN